jgi:hypothetical protein
MRCPASSCTPHAAAELPSPEELHNDGGGGDGGDDGGGDGGDGGGGGGDGGGGGMSDSVYAIVPLQVPVVKHVREIENGPLSEAVYVKYEQALPPSSSLL